MSRFQYSDKQKDKMVELYEQGVSTSRIAERFGSTKDSVRAMINAHRAVVIDLSDMTEGDSEERMQDAVHQIMGGYHDR